MLGHIADLPRWVWWHGGMLTRFGATVPGYGVVLVGLVVAFALSLTVSYSPTPLLREARY
eukprot:2412974-Rhodomonas_salina.1